MIGNAIVEARGDLGQTLQEQCPAELAKALGTTWDSLSIEDKRSDFAAVKTLAEAFQGMGIFGLDETYDKIELEMKLMNE